MTMKVCSKCGVEKTLDAYNRYAKSKDGRQPQCRECHKARYKDNKESHLQAIYRNKKERVKKHRLLILEMFKNGCLDCSESDPRCLEFDHVRGEKKGEVTVLLSSGYSWEVIQEEIDKCDIVCANCHKKRTYDRLDDC